jgi:hypothetical protein
VSINTRALFFVLSDKKVLGAVAVFHLGERAETFAFILNAAF